MLALSISTWPPKRGGEYDSSVRGFYEPVLEVAHIFSDNLQNSVIQSNFSTHEAGKSRFCVSPGRLEKGVW